jgi:hypothetical protein
MAPVSIPNDKFCLSTFAFATKISGALKAARI